MKLNTQRHDTIFVCIAVLGLLLLSHPVCAKEEEDGVVATSHTFRCQKSLADITSGVGRTPACSFRYFTLSHAEARVRCGPPDAVETNVAQEVHTGSASEAPSPSCNVSLYVALQLHNDINEQLREQVGTATDYFAPPKMMNEDDVLEVQQSMAEDAWRYSLSLTSMQAHITTNYRGYNGVGYSMCGELLHHSQAEWSTTGPFMHIHACPLPNGLTSTDAAADSSSTTAASTEVTGEVRRPLPRYLPGPWKVTMQLSRLRAHYEVIASAAIPDDAGEVNADAEEADLEVLGRIVVPFTLPPLADLPTSWFTTSDVAHTSTDITPVDADL